MKKYSFLIENSKAYRALNKQRQSYLFCSQDSIALDIAVNLLIKEQCGHYPSSSADIMYFSDKITVDDVDLINKTALISPIELKYKYFIIKSGAFLSDSASNKLLKLLEEPYKSVKIIIYCKDAFDVLKTISSRCIILRLNEIDVSKLNSVLDEHYESNSNLILAKEINLGSILRAEKAIRGEYNELLDLALNTLLLMQNDTLIFAQKLIEKKNNLYELIELFELILHDCLLNHCNQKINLLSKRSDIVKICLNYSVDSILKLNEHIIKAKIRINGFGNINSIVDEFLYNLVYTRRKE